MAAQMSIILQLLFNSIVSGLVLALMAVGFHLVFRTVKVFHLAHGAVFVAGGYAYLSIYTLVGGYLGWGLALIAAALTGGLLAVGMYLIVYRRLSARGASEEISLVASMGLLLFVTEGLAWAYGNQARVSAMPFTGSLELGGIMLSSAQWMQLVSCSFLLMLLVRGLKGKRTLDLRAVMGQATVASVMGVNVDAMKARSMAVSGVLAAWAGALVVVDTGIHPQVGLSITLSAAVAVILGGARSFKGTVAAAIGLALVQTLTEWFFNAQWKEGITFLILIIVLLWRTEGIIAFNLRPEER